jgi:hypothetical protein
MNHKDFEKLFKDLVEKETALMKSKGEEYCKGNPDRLHNFKDIAQDLGLDPLQIWAVYFKKHIDSILSYIKNGGVKSNESIQSRFYDARNYLALGLALIEEKEKKELPF